MLKRSLPYVVFILLLTFGFGLFPDSIQLRKTILRANQLTSDGKPEAALNLYTDLIRQNPDLVYLYPKAGSAAYRSGDLELAMYYLERANSRDLLSGAEKLMLGDTYLDSGDVEKAEMIWRKIDLDSETVEQVSERLVALDISRDRWEQARSDLVTWSQANPEDVKPQEMLGWVTLFLDPEDALTIFQELPSTKDGGYQKVVDQIFAYQDAGTDTKEIAAWWIKTGDLLASIGKYEFSLKAYSKAVDVAPENSIGWAKLALEKQGSDLDGKMEIGRALENGANDPYVNILIADYWKKAGQPELALIYLHKVISLDSENSYALNMIGWLLSDIRSVDAGMEYIKKAAMISDSSQGWMDVIQYCLTNTVYLREEAIPAARKAVGLSPDSPEVLNLAGQVYFSLDDLVTAERYFLKAISLKGDLYSTHLNLGYLYIKQNRYDVARDHLKIAVDQQASPEISERAIQAYAQLPVQ